MEPACRGSVENAAQRPAYAGSPQQEWHDLQRPDSGTVKTKLKRIGGKARYRLVASVLFANVLQILENRNWQRG